VPGEDSAPCGAATPLTGVSSRADGLQKIEALGTHRKKRGYIAVSSFAGWAARMEQDTYLVLAAQEKALWYVHKTLENGWSRNVPALQIESQLFERQAGKIGIDNFSERLLAPDSDLARRKSGDPF
jgi:hypothetical protein